MGITRQAALGLLRFVTQPPHPPGGVRLETDLWGGFGSWSGETIVDPPDP